MTFAPSSQADTLNLDRRPATSRSRLTNGRAPAGLDGRSAAYRRYKDIVASLTAEMGGELTYAERLRVEAIARDTLQAEALSAALQRGEAVSADDLTRCSNAIARGLNALRKAKVAKPKASAREALFARLGAEEAEGVP